MICKHCGAAIKDNQDRCPKCGMACARSNGVGFWDMVSGNTGTAPQEAPVEREMSEKRKSGILLPALILVLALGLCFSFFMNMRTMKELRNFRADAQYHMSMLEQSGKDAELALSGRIEAQEERIAALESEDAHILEEIGGLMPLTITHNPTGEKQPLGYISEEGRCLFMTRVSGRVDYFRWEKANAVTMQWESVEFDEQGFCHELGLRLDEDIRQGVSKLVAAGLNERSYGYYRCVAVAANGSLAETTVTELSNPAPAIPAEAETHVEAARDESAAGQNPMPYLPDAEPVPEAENTWEKQS